MAHLSSGPFHFGSLLCQKVAFFCGPTKCQELELYPRERKEIFVEHTVDGRNPAPVGTYWQLLKKVNNGIIVGQAIYQLIQDFFHPQYHTERIAPLSGLLLLLPSASRALSSAGLEPQVRFCEVPLPCTCPKMRDTREIAISLETKRWQTMGFRDSLLLDTNTIWIFKNGWRTSRLPNQDHGLS
jgi:hypothetical protein